MTINNQSTQFLFDGIDIVQESTAGVPTTNMLNGPGVDERHLANNIAASSTLLRDALGSTLALSDSSGIQTQYTYDPFGNTASSGTQSTNASQYTGRENDGTGLYYYRARYYSPALQRFISEDPIAFMGGDVNLYAMFRTIQPILATRQESFPHYWRRHILTIQNQIAEKLIAPRHPPEYCLVTCGKT